MTPVVTVSCLCGWSQRIDEPEGGQSLGGTAGWYMARHRSQCGQNASGHQTPTTVEYEIEVEA